MLVASNFDSIGTTPDTYLSMREEDVSKMTMLLIEKYKSRVTPIREIVINALETTDDAVKNGREFKPVEIHFDFLSPMKTLSPFSVTKNDIAKEGTIKVVDHGEGMSEDFIRDMFSFIGASTKDSDSDAIGGFGIGSKSVLSMTDYATWRTVKDGKATTLVMSRDGKGFTINQSTIDTDDDNGTTVTIPVNESVMKSVLDNIESEYLDFVSSSRVKVYGVDLQVGRVADNVSRTASNGVQFLNSKIKSNNSARYWSRTVDTYIMVNGAPYPTPEGAEVRSSMTVSIPNTNTINANAILPSVVVNLDQNDPRVSILGSREALVESDDLNDYIKELVYDAVREEVIRIMDTLAAAKNIEELTRFARDINDESTIDMFNYPISYVSYQTVIAGRDMSQIKLTSSLSNLLLCVGGYTHEESYNDINDQFRDFMIVDVNESKIASIRDIYHGDDCVIVSGTFDSKRNTNSDYIVNTTMPAWKQALNSCLNIATTDNMLYALTNARTTADLMTEHKIDYITGDTDAVFVQLVSLLAAIHYWRNGGNATITPEVGEEIEKFCAPVLNKITMNNDVKSVRDDIKSTIRKNNAKSKPVRLTQEERIDRSKLHVYSYVDGKGYELKKFFKSSTELGNWLEENNVYWMEMGNEDARQNSYYLLNYDVMTNWSNDQAYQVAHSVPTKDLHIVVTRSRGISARMDMIKHQGVRVCDNYNSKEFLRNAASRAEMFDMNFDFLSDNDDNHKSMAVINSFNIETMDGENVLELLVDTFEVDANFKKFVKQYVKGNTEKSMYDWDIITLLTRDFDKISHLFTQGNTLATAAKMVNGIYYCQPDDKDTSIMKIFKEANEVVKSLGWGK